MRNNFIQPDWISLDQDSAHSLPISQMGNYQEYLKRQTPQLREIESAPVRQHMFGNPFKIGKRMMVDEADIDLVGSPGASRNNKRPNPNADVVMRLPSKRKPRPLPKNFSIRRSTDSSPYQSPTSPAPSPIPWTSVIEKDLPRFDESPSVIVNGLDSPSSSERSRSPSPTLDLPACSVNDISSGNFKLMTNHYSYSTSVNTDTLTTNSLSETYSTPSVEVDKQISLILKEANNVNNMNQNFVNDVKPLVICESREEIETQNFEIRKNLNRLVRKPGKNFSELFENIKTLKGDIDMQVEIVKLVIKESLRFKRKYLASLLEEHIQTLLSVENK